MNKDIIAIISPDIHGRKFWKEVIDVYDGSVPFIFLGDYLDPYNDEGITPNDAKENFEELWKFKEKWGDKIIMLLGNHDLSYYDKMFKTCRFSYENYSWYHDFLINNIHQFKISHSIQNEGITYIFSHAGINPKWLSYNNFENILSSDYINSLFFSNKSSFTNYSFYRGGYCPGGSPVWADIREFLSKDLKFDDENIKQIVGHTQLNSGMFEANNVSCIDSRQLFVITKDNLLKEYKEFSNDKDKERF